jgi:hypothetical protein
MITRSTSHIQAGIPAKKESPMRSTGKRMRQVLAGAIILAAIPALMSPPQAAHAFGWNDTSMGNQPPAACPRSTSRYAEYSYSQNPTGFLTLRFWSCQVFNGASAGTKSADAYCFTRGWSTYNCDRYEHASGRLANGMWEDWYSMQLLLKYPFPLPAGVAYVCVYFRFDVTPQGREVGFSQPWMSLPRDFHGGWTC